MEIIAGMLLLCNVYTNFSLGTYKARVADVETKVHFIHPRGDVFVEYNLKKHKTFTYTADEPLYDVIQMVDMKRKDFMNCRKLNENR